MTRIAAALAVLLALSCSSPSKRGPSTEKQRLAAAPAIEALRAAQFEPAKTKASEVLAADPNNAEAAGARALAVYITALSGLRREIEGVLDTVGPSGFDHPRMRTAIEATLTSLAQVRRDLDTAAASGGFALELCLACWERDWNHSGEIDNSDRRFLEIEIDASGTEYPEADPRRRPTFRFDVGDIHWARAMVSFQSAIFEVLLAYKWSPIFQGIMLGFAGEPPKQLTIPLEDPARIARAKALALEGFDAAEASRLAYLAETDDDREWVPNPTQKSHPLPLPVDAALYETWAGVLSDLRHLVSGQTALSVADLAQLGDNQWARPPGGFVDVGQMLNAPKTIVIDIESLEQRFETNEDPSAADIEGMLRDILGPYYVTEHTASPIAKRLSRMKSEIDRDTDTFERKLRYLLWLN